MQNIKYLHKSSSEKKLSDLINSGRPIILVDVDQPIVDTVDEWILDWYCKKSDGKRLTLEAGKHFGIDASMKAGLPAGINPFDYWKDYRLYDNLIPNEDSIEILEYALKLDYGFVFESTCHPEHIDSKADFLNHYFPNNSGVIAKPLGVSKGDSFPVSVAIDDSPFNLISIQKHNPNALCLLYPSILLSQNDITTSSFPYVNDWNDIREHLEIHREALFQNLNN